MKKILSLILAALLVLSMGAVALAEETTVNNSDDNVDINAYLSWDENNIENPALVNVKVTWQNMNFTYSNYSIGAEGTEEAGQKVFDPHIYASGEGDQINVINYSQYTGIVASLSIAMTDVAWTNDYGIVGYVNWGSDNAYSNEEGASVSCRTLDKCSDEDNPDNEWFAVGFVFQGGSSLMTQEADFPDSQPRDFAKVTVTITTA